MKYIKPYKIFEINDEGYDLDEIEDYFIDFKQKININIDIKKSSSRPLDFSKLLYDDNDPDTFFIASKDIDFYILQDTSTSNINIELYKWDQPQHIRSTFELDLDELTYSYEELSSYMLSKYGSIISYIYVVVGWSYRYFRSLDDIKNWMILTNGTKFKINKIEFSFTI